MNLDDLTIDAEFESFLPGVPKLTDDELEASIARDGRPTKPITVWKGKDIVVDGHRRLRVCRKLGLPFEVEEREFLNRKDVLAWMVSEQLSRRNLNDLDWAKFSHILLQADGKRGAAKRVAEATGVTVRTVYRREHLNDALAKLPEEIRKRIERGQLTPTQQEVFALAELPEFHILRVVREFDSGAARSLWEAIQGDEASRPANDAPLDSGGSGELAEPSERHNRDTVSPKVETKEDDWDSKEFFKAAFGHLGRFKSLMTQHRHRGVGISNKILAKIDHIDSHLSDWKENGDE